MQKKEWMMAFLDNQIQLIYKEKEYNFENQESLHFGKIVNPTLFIEQFGDFLKKKKLKRSLFGDNISVIHNAFWNKSDETITNSALNYLGFSSINFIDETSLYDHKEKTLWVHCCKTYISMHFLEEYYKKIIYVDEILNNIDKEFIRILKQIIKKYPQIKSIYLVGNHTKELQRTVERAIKLPTYLFPNKNNYFISQLKNSN